jgi:bile acid-coenzyme A ligase
MTSFPARLAQLTADDPGGLVACFVGADGSEHELRRRTFLLRSRQVARLLLERGVCTHDIVAVGLANTADNLIALMALWTIGACPLPLNPHQPSRERGAMLEVASAQVLIAEEAVPGIELVSLADLAASQARSDEPLPDKLAAPSVAMGSGGSSGRPKVILSMLPWTRRPGDPFGPFSLAELGLGGAEVVQLVPGALFNNTPFGFTWLGVFEGHRLIIMERFDAELAITLIERKRVTFIGGVPTMLRRMALSPRFQHVDLSSLAGVFHTGGACPAHVKRAWIDRVGAERVIEGYGQTEGIGATAIRGDEWLAHPGSVGRPPAGLEVKVLDPLGIELGAGTVGELWFRRDGRHATSYLGAEPLREQDGFKSVGDLGWVDDDGYLYVADRRTDMIVTGASNVFPAEVEAVLLLHPEIADAAVIGLPDDEWGRRIHAVLTAFNPSAPPAEQELVRHCRDHLSHQKIPKNFEFVDTLPRDEAGKLRRARLVDERTTPE